MYETIFPVIAVVFSYVLTTLSVLQFAGSVYLLTYRITETRWVAELALILVSSALSLLYLGTNLVLARRYLREDIRHTRTGRRGYASFAVLGFIAVVWLAAFIMGLLVALNPTNHSRLPLNVFKFQEAGFAGPLSAFIFTLFVLGAQYVASLAGIHTATIEQEEEAHLSRKMFTDAPETCSVRQLEILNRDLNFFPQHLIRSATPQIRSSPPPPLTIHIPAASDPYNSPFSSPSNNLIPFNQIAGIDSSPMDTRFKSTYPENSRQQTSLSSVGTVSTTRSSSSVVPLRIKYGMPKSPQKYRRQASYSSCNSEKPTRPGSRPSMPPAAFWKYAAEQQMQGDSPGTLQSWQIASNAERRESSIFPSPILATPRENAHTWNKKERQGNDGATRKTSYESGRRGVSDIHDDYSPAADIRLERIWQGSRAYRIANGEGGNSRPQSKRLVKKRPLQDAEPRHEHESRT